jgi:hypothetical protein
MKLEKREPNGPPYTQTDVLVALNDLMCKGWVIQIYRSDLGTPTAAAKRKRQEHYTDGFHNFGTDDAILALWDKVHKTGPYAK